MALPKQHKEGKIDTNYRFSTKSMKNEKELRTMAKINDNFMCHAGVVEVNELI